MRSRRPQRHALKRSAHGVLSNRTPTFGPPESSSLSSCCFLVSTHGELTVNYRGRGVSKIEGKVHSDGSPKVAVTVTRTVTARARSWRGTLRGRLRYKATRRLIASRAFLGAPKLHGYFAAAPAYHRLRSRVVWVTRTRALCKQRALARVTVARTLPSKAIPQINPRGDPSALTICALMVSCSASRNLPNALSRM
jgi:hypothetical protein